MHYKKKIQKYNIVTASKKTLQEKRRKNKPGKDIQDTSRCQCKKAKSHKAKDIQGSSRRG